ncbi:CBS domain-containing protein [Actinomycetospora chibensis]|uniref:CBS domain-containing protein n=1 Tax=Actinomycetospora chibensis TaxID=663606 RepID=A0ABV9RAY4_9PSEU|nr:CBS domain-containing protein [Actinomycetospora chibensis]MDD7922172.1 CBS domain-containing protein [Actinomycetospora chibensis]
MNHDQGPRRARDLMTSPVLTVPPDAPRAAAAALLVSHGIASAPVVDARGRLLGMVDERGLVGGDDAAPAAELMTRATAVAGPDTPIDELVDRLLASGTRAVPVVREDIPIGIVSRRDVLRRVARGELLGEGSRAPDDRVPADPDVPPDGPVVVGIDGSEGSVRALRWAARAAASTGAPLVAVIACETPDLYGTPAQVVAEAGLRLATTVRRALGADEAARRALTENVREGRPMRVLVEASEGARLLVVGSRHVDGPGGPPGGSLTARLVSRARCPVVAVVPAPAESPGAPVAEAGSAVPVT